MEFCQYNHEEIVFNSSHCPLCKVIREKEDLEKELDLLKRDYETLESTVQDLTEENEQLNKASI